MSLSSRLARYYKQCLYEEAKINLHKEDTELVKLHGYEKLIHNYPEPYEAQEDSAILTQLMLKNALDKNKQLIYGYMFITGTLEDGTEIYTPLIYADCKIDRVCGKCVVTIDESSVTLNVPMLAQLVPSDENRSVIISALAETHLINLPVTEECIKELEQALADLIPALDVTGKAEAKIHLNRENAVILATVNKGLAGIIKELDLISKAPTSALSNTALAQVDSADYSDDVQEALDTVYPNLFPICKHESNTLDRFLPALKLDNSQREVAKQSATNMITAITGAPGTGKSNTISAIATNYILNGKSVLICSKMNSAVDVVYNKLSVLSRHPYCVRTGGKDYRKHLSQLIDMITSNDFKLNEKHISTMNGSISYMNEIYDNNQVYYDRVKIKNELEDKCSHVIAKHEKLKGLQRLFHNIELKKALKEKWIACDLCSEAHEKYTGEERFTDLRQQFLSNIASGRLASVQSNNTFRRDLMLYSKALKKNQVDKYDCNTIFSDLVNKVLPCWCSTNTDVNSSIPLIAGLFDVVIIDEASQCDIASCLPLLYRAKRAVIVGDDKQLKYLSFLPTAVNNANISNNNIGKFEYVCNYRENSMFDFAQFFSNCVTMLQYQYRGNSDLMGFSNYKFYNSNLTNVNQTNYKDTNAPISTIRCFGETAVGKTRNDEEVKAVITMIRGLINHDIEIGKLFPTSIGVLSPFREQVKLLQKRISQSFTLEEIKKHNIIVGTAHSFQGEERDVMLLSWAVADNTPLQSFTFINNPNLFNVSVTRANKRVINFISATEIPDGLLKEYLEYSDMIFNNFCEKQKEVENTPTEVA